jgi:hypothetical protein
LPAAPGAACTEQEPGARAGLQTFSLNTLAQPAAMFRGLRTKEKAPPKTWRDQHIGTRGRAYLLVAQCNTGLFRMAQGKSSLLADSAPAKEISRGDAASRCIGS